MSMRVMHCNTGDDLNRQGTCLTWPLITLDLLEMLHAYWRVPLAAAPPLTAQLHGAFQSDGHFPTPQLSRTIKWYGK